MKCHFRAFPTNAATMGVVTLIMKACSTEEVNTYEAMRRIRQNVEFEIETPPVIDQYFGQNQRRRYHHNISTIATDGCNILHIARPDISMSRPRIYVETIYYAMPTYQDDTGVSTNSKSNHHSVEIVRFSCHVPRFYVKSILVILKP